MDITRLLSGGTVTVPSIDEPYHDQWRSRYNIIIMFIANCVLPMVSESFDTYSPELLAMNTYCVIYIYIYIYIYM